MIEITHKKGCITIKGHAEYAEHGKDIVCAAISTLSQTFIASVEKLPYDNLKCEISAGNAVIRYRNLSREAQLLLNSFFIGCELVANTYPENVRLSKH